MCTKCGSGDAIEHTSSRLMLMDAGTAPDHFCSFIEVIIICFATDYCGDGRFYTHPTVFLIVKFIFRVSKINFFVTFLKQARRRERRREKRTLRAHFTWGSSFLSSSRKTGEKLQQNEKESRPSPPPTHIDARLLRICAAS